MMIRSQQDHIGTDHRRGGRLVGLRWVRRALADGRIDAAGFSLIEVMIVVVILAILATLLAPRVMGRTDDAKRAAVKAQTKNIESALQLL